MEGNVEEKEILQDVKVLDFCWVVAGPMATRYLADFGATVIKLESKTKPDTLRNTRPFKGSEEGLDSSSYYANYNAGKFSFSLNMKHPKSINIVERLVKWSDIVAENFTPGTLEKWNLGYDQLKKIKPDIILFSTSMLGRGGTDSNQPGFGPVLSALAGYSHMTGWAEGFPESPYGAYTDFIAPKFGVTAILAALEHRNRTGQGVHIEISQLEAALQFISPLLLDAGINKSEPQRCGNSHLSAVPHGIFPCLGEDRWISIAVFNDQEWNALCEIMGDSYWSENDKKVFETFIGRKANENYLNDKIASWTKKFNSYELMNTLQQASINAGVVQDARDLFNDPQLKFRSHFIWLEHPIMGNHCTQQNEIRLNGTSAKYKLRAPLLGEHTQMICKDILKMTDAEFKTYQEEGVFI